MRERTGNFQGIERRAYSVQEFAAAYGLGKSLAYDLVQRGEIAAVRVGRRIIIPREAAEEWLRKKAQQGQ